MKLGKPAGRKASSTRQPIKHSKTFSGCWTCRSRHVKCSEERPACARCTKGGFQCGGYGIKLVWVDGSTQEREQNIRRVIGSPAIYDDESPFTQVDVNDALDEIERLSMEGKCLSAGPFSVFPKETTRADTAGAFWSSDSEVLQEPLRVFPAVRSNTNEDWDEVNSVECTIISPSILGTSPATHDSHYKFWPSPATGTPPSPMRQYLSNPTLSTRHLDLLPRPAEQRALIHHWTDFVCWHLVPVDREDNPFRSVFTPMALAGLTSSSHQSTGEVALFHALCATSAYSRGQLLNNEAKTLTLAMKHYNLAIMHLRHSLASLKEHPNSHQVDLQRGSILATVTMFSAMDMITGRSSEWRTHLQGGASWLSTIDESAWNRDKSSSMVYQGYLAIAALCNVNLPSAIIESDNFLGDTRHYVLDRFFGLTQPILKHIVMMNSLMKRISSSADARPDPESLDRLEEEFYTQSPENLDVCGQELSPFAHSLTLHHAYVFYYASLIHFHRTIRQLPPSSPRVQNLVTSAIDRLEEIEKLGGDSIGCTLVWPPFVVACECVDPDMQGRILEWYMCKRRHGFMNLEISKDIAREVWRRRTLVGEEVDVHWQNVLKEMDADIVLA
ncbi:arginine metabolism regulation protein II [Cladophialophora chaetospira]|uniref:Arginine metabolism regulation protein II n=1 Tax=Cladophialophora chaetospira TaxID=386627 RepID=A0AA39CPZ8_9EURO|nr:arginine metabolism regulation protein II [Cladophialophora chaetospira]